MPGDEAFRRFIMLAGDRRLGEVRLQLPADNEHIPLDEYPQMRCRASAICARQLAMKLQSRLHTEIRELTFALLCMGERRDRHGDGACLRSKSSSHCFLARPPP
jgi:hypothetical protein